MTTEGTRRGRPPRQSQVNSERRRRDDSNFQASQKLAIPEEVQARLKAEGRTPRWVNDEGNRLHRLTVRDDYDKVEGVDPVPVGTDPSGKPIMAHLLSKPAEFIEQDKRTADERRRAVERAMVRGEVPSAPGADPQPVEGALGASTYVVKGSSIGRENQILD